MELYVVYGEGYPISYGSETILLGVFKEYPNDDILYQAKKKLFEYIIRENCRDFGDSETIENMEVKIQEVKEGDIIDVFLSGYIE